MLLEPFAQRQRFPAQRPFDEVVRRCRGGQVCTAQVHTFWDLRSLTLWLDRHTLVGYFGLFVDIKLTRRTIYIDMAQRTRKVQPQ